MAIFSLTDSSSLRMKLEAEQQKQISSFYQGLVEQANKAAESYKGRDNISSVLRSQYLTELGKDLSLALEESELILGNTIESNMLKMAEQVNVEIDDWNTSLGIPSGGRLFNVPKSTIENVITGKVYDGDWSLSGAIWSDIKSKQSDINKVIAEGIAMNKSTYDIAKDLETYVDPSAVKSWDWSKVYPGTSRKIDYNAQRLARTMVSHAYQQTLVDSVKHNPFVSGIKWRSAMIHGRTCQLCMDRNGKVFQKQSLPLDHPNGLCTFLAVTESIEKVSDDLADWVNGKDNPALDSYAKWLGYDIGDFVKAANGASKFGTSQVSDFNAWKKTLSDSKVSELTEYLKDNEIDDVHQWYVLNVKNGGAIKDLDITKRFSPSAEDSFYTWQNTVDEDTLNDFWDYLTANQLDSPNNFYLQNIKIKTTTDDVIESVTKNVTKDVTEDVVEDYIMPSSKDWLGVLQKQDTMELLEKEANVLSKLSQQQIDSLRGYTGQDYRDINDFLRGELKDISQENLEDIDNIIDGINSVGGDFFDEPMILRRGTHYDEIGGLLGDDVVDKLRFMNEDDVRDLLVGSVGEYKSFVSTSSGYRSGFGGEIEILFYAPKGTNGVQIATISDIASEQEVLLNAGTKFKILDVGTVGNMESAGTTGALRIFMEILV